MMEESAQSGGNYPRGDGPHSGILRTSQQRRCFWLYCFILAALTTAPYILGFAQAGDEWRFTGFVFGVQDGNSYIAKMLQGSFGAWLFRTPYSAEPQSGVVAFLPYLLLGKLAAPPELHLQLVALFHLFRILMIPLGVWTTYRFLSLFLKDPSWLAWSTVMATVGSGLGWLLVLIGKVRLVGSLPLGFISPETFGFLAYFGLPHLILARVLLLLALITYLEAAENPRRGWAAGGILALLGLVQPLTILSAYAAIGMHQLILFLVGIRGNLEVWRSRWLPGALRTLTLSLPVVIYFALSFSLDPFLRRWTEQNRILSPHPLHYLVAYGLLLPFVLYGLSILIKEHNALWYFPIGWVLATPILVYFPHNLQRRLPEGSWVAIVLLATVGLERLLGSSSRRRLIRTVLMGLSLITPIFLIFGGLNVAAVPGEPAFRPSGEVEAFLALREAAAEGAIVLSSIETGNALPAWTPQRVLIGHGPESVNKEQIQPQLEAFFEKATQDSERQQFLDAYGIEYLFYGPAERALGSWDPAGAELFGRVYQQGDYVIYAVEAGP